MGRGIVVSHLGAARYRVAPTVGVAAAANELARLEADATKGAETLAKAHASLLAALEERTKATAAVDATLSAWLAGLISATDTVAPPLNPSGAPIPPTDDELADDLFTAVNARRSAAGLGSLSRSAALDSAARAVCATLAGGRRAADSDWSPEQRAAVASYAWDAAVGVGRAVALGETSPEAAARTLGTGLAAATEGGVGYRLAPLSASGYCWALMSAKPGPVVAAVVDPADPAKADADATTAALDPVATPAHDPEVPKAVTEAVARAARAGQAYAAARRAVDRLTVAAAARALRIAELEAVVSEVPAELDVWHTRYERGLLPGTAVPTGEVQARAPVEGKLNIIPDGFAAGLIARSAQLPDAPAFVAAALEPGHVRWRPAWRHALLTELAGDLGSIILVEERARPIEPGEAPLSLSPAEIYEDVPIDYPPCNGGPFVVGDYVLVQFADQDRTQPRIVGFRDHPRSCIPPFLSQDLGIWHGAARAMPSLSAGPWPWIEPDTPTPAIVSWAGDEIFIGGDVVHTSASGAVLCACVVTILGVRYLRYAARTVVTVPVQVLDVPLGGSGAPALRAYSVCTLAAADHFEWSPAGLRIAAWVDSDSLGRAVYEGVLVPAGSDYDLVWSEIVTLSNEVEIDTLTYGTTSPGGGVQVRSELTHDTYLDFILSAGYADSETIVVHAGRLRIRGDATYELSDDRLPYPTNFDSRAHYLATIDVFVSATGARSGTPAISATIIDLTQVLRRWDVVLEGTAVASLVDIRYEQVFALRCPVRLGPVLYENGVWTYREDIDSPTAQATFEQFWDLWAVSEPPYEPSPGAVVVAPTVGRFRSPAGVLLEVPAKTVRFRWPWWGYWRPRIEGYADPGRLVPGSPEWTAGDPDVFEEWVKWHTRALLNGGRAPTDSPPIGSPIEWMDTDLWQWDYAGTNTTTQHDTVEADYCALNLMNVPGVSVLFAAHPDGYSCAHLTSRGGDPARKTASRPSVSTTRTAFDGATLPVDTASAGYSALYELCILSEDT